MASDPNLVMYGLSAITYLAIYLVYRRFRYDPSKVHPPAPSRACTGCGTPTGQDPFCGGCGAPVGGDPR